jgi:tetratricopeptide (TPR) repeat protein
MKSHSLVKTNYWEDLFLSRWHPYAWLILVGFLLYAKTLFFNFTYLDDNRLILDNFYVLKSLGNIFHLFAEDVFLSTNNAYYRPLLNASLMLEAQLGGTSPFIYHLGNLLLHLTASCSVYLFFKKLRYSAKVAFIFSLIVAVHPVLTQAVAWIPGRNDTLLTIFVLVAFILFIDFLTTKKLAFAVGHIFFFLLALFTKELALLLPFLAIVYLLFINKKQLSINEKVAFIFSWSVAMLTWLLLRSLAFKHPLPMTGLDLAKSLVQNSPAGLLYLGKIIFPINLTVLPILKDSNLIYGLITTILLTICFVFTKQKRDNFMVFGLAWFLFFLFPSFLRPNPEVPADFIDHRIYLPFIGFFIALIEINPLKHLLATNRLLNVLGIFIIFVLMVVSFKHSDVFKNRLTFWQNAVSYSPHYPLTHRNLGAMYYLDNKFDEAEREYQRALELNPQEPMAHNNLGLIYVNWGRLDKAEEEYQKEITINPEYDDAYFNLGLLYEKTNRPEEAVKNWQKTISLNPNYLYAYNLLALYYYRQGNLALAKTYAYEVINRGGQLLPDVAELLN